MIVVKDTVNKYKITTLQERMLALLRFRRYQALG